MCHVSTKFPTQWHLKICSRYKSKNISAIGSEAILNSSFFLSLHAKWGHCCMYFCIYMKHLQYMCFRLFVRFFPFLFISVPGAAIIRSIYPKLCNFFFRDSSLEFRIKQNKNKNIYNKENLGSYEMYLNLSNPSLNHQLWICFL